MAGKVTAGAAEVEVDLETGKVTVLRYHAGVYAGQIINPVQAELQTEGNVAFGIGQALFEEMIFDNGQLQNGNLGDYMIASIDDMPPEIDLNVLGRLDASADAQLNAAFDRADQLYRHVSRVFAGDVLDSFDTSLRCGGETSLFDQTRGVADLFTAEFDTRSFS